MSSTGRSDVREKDDFYATPAWCTDAILPVLVKALPLDAVILDPFAGKGAILAAARARRDRCADIRDPYTVIGGSYGLRGIELDADRGRRCQDDAFPCEIGDAFALEWGGPDLVLTNPPFSLALEAVERALAQITKGGVVAMLLRMNFLASQARAAFHKTHPANIHVLPRRPSFAASLSCGRPKRERCGWAELVEIEAPRPKACPGCGGRVSVTTSDSTEYAWFVWGMGVGGHWSILELPS